MIIRKKQKKLKNDKKCRRTEEKRSKIFGTAAVYLYSAFYAEYGGMQKTNTVWSVECGVQQQKEITANVFPLYGYFFNPQNDVDVG